jgi:hypothetical protein
MRKYLAVIALFISLSGTAQTKNNEVILGIGIDSRLEYQSITHFGIYFSSANTPIIDEGRQLLGNALSLSLMVKNSRFRLMYGIEYSCRYEHLYYKTVYPDTTNTWQHAVQEPVNGLITDYIFIIKKELTHKRFSLWAELGLGFMNRGSDYYYQTYGGKTSSGSQVIYGTHWNSCFNSYIIGVSFRKEWLYLSFRGHIVPENKHHYDRLRTFWIPNLVFQYQIPLSLKSKTDQ